MGSNDKKPLPSEVVATVNAALDEFERLVSQREVDLLGPAGAQKAFFFALQAKAKRGFRRPRRCVVPGCSKQSIAASHSLQRNGPLRAIAENGHVLTPEISVPAGRLELARVGIGEASTFPGFCREHESWFGDLEQKKHLSEERHVVLQVFRTVCREVVLKRQLIADYTDTLGAWKNVLTSGGLAIVNAKLRSIQHKYPDVKLSGLKVEGGSGYEATLLSARDELQTILMRLETEMLPASMADVEGRSPGMAHFVMTITHSLPVCLAGLGNFHIRDENKNIDINASAILNVWPTPNAVTFSMAVLEAHSDYLNAYIGHQLPRSLGPLEMVESWMVSGTDHWFVTPSIWAAIPRERQVKILDDILDDSHDIGRPCPHSIFDSARTDMLRLADSGQGEVDKAAELRKLGAV